MIKIKVPATSANIGCGFDTLGIALTFYATFTIEKSEQFYVTGCPTPYQNEDNLVLIAYKKVFEHIHQHPIPIKLHIDSPIPLARGLGSSAACIAAGVWAANLILGKILTKKQCLTIATELEGHPDNVAPAFYGGLCASFVDEQIHCVQLPVSNKLKLLAMIPDFEVSTKQARKVLPKQVDYKDAIFNLSRIVCLCKAMETYDKQMLHDALQDRLHEPYRRLLIHEYETIKQICQDQIAFFISGSGPTLICIYDDCTTIKKELMKLHHHWTCIECTIDQQGIQEEIYD